MTFQDKIYKILLNYQRARHFEEKKFLSIGHIN